MSEHNASQLHSATLGGGCFWCLEAVFQTVRGVESVVSGYAGGQIEHPDYRAVCTGSTGHAEVVQIGFDPAELDYASLLRMFFAIHDPTTRNRQGADVGSQYRSVIFYHDDAQRACAEQLIAELDAARIWPAPIVTEIAPLPEFYPAEDDHQNYFLKHPGQGYCQAVITPKLAKFRAAFAERLSAG